MLLGDTVIYRGQAYTVVGFTPMSVVPAQIQPKRAAAVRASGSIVTSSRRSSSPTKQRFAARAGARATSDGLGRLTLSSREPEWRIGDGWAAAPHRPDARAPQRSGCPTQPDVSARSALVEPVEVGT
jgi:hypothetical protein